MLILTIVAILLLFYRKRIILICHASFSPEMASVDNKEIEKEYYVKKQKIDLCGFLKRSAKGEAIDIQDDAINKISEVHNCELGFYGVAHTPSERNKKWN